MKNRSRPFAPALRKQPKPYTTAVFEVGGRIYHGCAQFDRSTSYKPWYGWLVHDGTYFMTLGDFQTIHELWAHARTKLGIPVEPTLLQREGEGTDGGPFGRSDETHKR